jgi:hypothetical protein
MRAGSSSGRREVQVAASCSPRSGRTCGSIGVDRGGNPIPAQPIPGGSIARDPLAFTGSPVPAGATGVLLDATIISPPGGSTGGFVTVFPGDAANPPLASTLNPVTPVAFNFWEVRTGADATISLFSTNALDVAIHGLGFYR